MRWIRDSGGLSVVWQRFAFCASVMAGGLCRDWGHNYARVAAEFCKFYPGQPPYFWAATYTTNSLFYWLEASHQSVPTCKLLAVQPWVGIQHALLRGNNDRGFRGPRGPLLLPAAQKTRRLLPRPKAEQHPKGCEVYCRAAPAVGACSRSTSRHVAAGLPSACSHLPGR